MGYGAGSRVDSHTTNGCTVLRKGMDFMLNYGEPSEADGQGHRMRGGVIIQRMEFLEVIEKLGPEGIKDYLHESHGQADYNHLRERLFMGETVVQAARFVANFGMSSRSYHTLLYHARDLRRIILEECGRPVSEIVGELLSKGSVRVGADRLQDVRQAFDEQGLRVMEETTFTLVGREDR